MTSSILKKTLLSVALSASLVATASASEIVFTTGYGDIQTFTALDLLAEGIGGGTTPATVTQTDTNGDGKVSVGDTFVETGGSTVLSYLPNTGSGSIPVVNGYNLVYAYQINGFVSSLTPDTNNGDFDLSLGFSTGTASMTMVDVDNIQPTVTLFSGILQAAACDVNVKIDGANNITAVDPQGVCSIDFLMDDITAGYMTYNGADISTFTGLQIPVFSTVGTVQDISGLNLFYATSGGSQKFDISHDANATIDVPEPTSLALLGLGLLGFGAAQRRKK